VRRKLQMRFADHRCRGAARRVPVRVEPRDAVDGGDQEMQQAGDLADLLERERGLDQRL
jgi:hypothetical protein